jgi:hypothetical protein
MNIVHDTPELRAELDAHNANAIRLHLPTAPVTWIDMKVEAPDGSVAHEHREKSNSWVRNYYNAVAGVFLPSTAPATYGAGYLGQKDTGGTARANATSTAYAAPDVYASWAGIVNNSTYGIVVGTGTGAEDFESYAMGAQVANGSGAGQLAHQAGAIGTATYTSETKKWTQTNTRIFNNNSAGEIVVTETGLIGRGYAGGSTNYMLLERNLLAEAVTVPAAYKLTVTYTTEITFPA